MKLALVLLLVAAVLYWLMRRGAAKTSRPERRVSNSSRRSGDDSRLHRAVSVDCRGAACAKAGAIAGNRYLLGTAPALPLPECDRSACRCRYVHHQDRRADDGDRRLHGSLESNLYGAIADRERRERSGRRSSDLTEALELGL